MNVAEQFFADRIGTDPIDGRFLLASGRTARVRVGTPANGIPFRSGEGRPDADMIVLVDATPEDGPRLVGAIMTEDASKHMVATGGGHWYVPTEVLLPEVAILHDAVACCDCGHWPAPFIEGGARRCRQHSGRREIL